MHLVILKFLVKQPFTTIFETTRIACTWNRPSWDHHNVKTARENKIHLGNDPIGAHPLDICNEKNLVVKRTCTYVQYLLQYVWCNWYQPAGLTFKSNIPKVAACSHKACMRIYHHSYVFYWVYECPCSPPFRPVARVASALCMSPVALAEWFSFHSSFIRLPPSLSGFQSSVRARVIEAHRSDVDFFLDQIWPFVCDNM